MDISFWKNKNRIAAISASVICLVSMLVFSDISILSAKKGIAMWAGSILPAMLPFLIFSGFISRMNIGEYMNRKLFTFIMSAISGYPTCSKITGDMIRRGEITDEKGKSILAFSNVTGPAFIIGVVGSGFLGSSKAGTIIALSHYLSALLSGFIISFLLRNRNDGARTIKRDKLYVCESSIFDTLTYSILDALKTLGIILCYIVIFMFITDLIDSVFMFDTSNIAKAVYKGLIEMSVGCASLSGVSDNISQRMIIASFIISFGGLSVTGQSMAMLSGTGIKVSYIIFSKLFHAVLASCVCAFLLGINQFAV